MAEFLADAKAYTIRTAKPDAALVLTETAATSVAADRPPVQSTFQEAGGCLGLETTRGWREKTAPHAGPCRLELYPVVAVLFPTLLESKRTGAVWWPGKATVTFESLARAFTDSLRRAIY